MVLITAIFFWITYTSLPKTKDISRSIDNLSHLNNALKLINRNDFGNLEKPKDSYKTYQKIDKELRPLMHPDSFYKMQPEHARDLVELKNLLDTDNISREQTNDSSLLQMNPVLSEKYQRQENIRIKIEALYNSEIQKLNFLNQEQTGTYKKIIKLLIACFIICVILMAILCLILMKNFVLRNSIEKQLLSAKNKAQEVSHAKTQLINSMSHELRNPVNGIIGMAALLMQTNLNSEQKKFANNIHRSTVALLAVVNDVIDFSKIESGTLKLENTPFVLKDCIKEVFSIIGWGIKEINLTYHIDEKIPVLIIGDTSRLRQVLINLIGSAIKYTAKGYIHLSVTSLADKADTLTLEFQIEDSGTTWTKNGTEPAVPFQTQAFDYTKANGYGLGLSIAARIVALMGGGIKVESFADKGIVFNFSIIVKKVAPDAQIQLKTKPFNNRPDTLLSKKIPLKILVVDDHEMNQLLLSSILMMMGYNCTIARNGSEAVARAIEEKYDLIFMDIYMPVMDGLEATRAIRHYYLKENDPIIVAITANALLEEKENGLQAGMNDFVIKPYQVADIQQTIIKWGKPEPANHLDSESNP